MTPGWSGSCKAWNGSGTGCRLIDHQAINEGAARISAQSLCQGRMARVLTSTLLLSPGEASIRVRGPDRTKDLRRLARQVDATDPDGTLPDDQLQQDRRFFRMRPTKDGGYAWEFRPNTDDADPCPEPVESHPSGGFRLGLPWRHGR
jgi:hypothetical protein